jgi:phosphoribosylamine---glycine ligase
MKILVVGGGGREHALVWKLAQSPEITRMWAAPGNAGIGGERLAKNQEPVACVPVGAEDLAKLLGFAREQRPDLTVVGPDNPLASGIVDLFEQNGLRIWGPNRQAAQFEASKSFSQQFMERHGIPTARSAVFARPQPAKAFAASLRGRCAVKADGLALGKGVLLCSNEVEADRAIDAVLIDRAFGAAGNKLVIQELLQGRELSLHALCDGSRAALFPSSKDHKRALDGEQGLNTGGMGTCSPAPSFDETQLAGLEESILQPWLRGCKAEGIDFRGILYPGIMLTSRGPKVLEFNARFGDPETQVYLPRLENDLLTVLEASLEGRLDKVQLKWSSLCAVCVVMASAGYPGSYARGRLIEGLEEAGRLDYVKVFHAGTARAGGRIATNGGRVLGVTGWGSDLAQARERAYAAVERIHFEGAHYRRDIACPAAE